MTHDNTPRRPTSRELKMERMSFWLLLLALPSGAGVALEAIDCGVDVPLAQFCGLAAYGLVMVGSLVLGLVGGRYRGDCI
jgi:hypothetical protein